jgi:hypothetical protein
MKNVKSILIAAVLICTMINVATAGGFSPKPKKIVDITINQVFKYHGLVISMLQQIDPDFLNNNQQVYTVKVLHQGTLYLISGTYEQWVTFFKLRWKYPIDVSSRPDVL